MDDPIVSVIVAAHDAEATIERTLEALAAQRFDRPYEVIVVDDGSRDRTAALAESAPGVTVLRRERQGPAAARNAGVSRARAATLAFTDADCFPRLDWLQKGIAALEGHDVVQGAVHADPGARRGPYDRTLWVTEDRGLYQTANLLMRRETFERCGGFDEWVGPDTDRRGHFGEDVDLVWRARRRGARVVFATDAVVEHAVFPRSAAAYVGERRRLRHFPALARRVPELRGRLFFAGLFHTRRSAAFDLALAGLLLAVVLRGLRPLLAGVPYLAVLAAALRGRRPRAAVVELLADAVGCASLVEGSLRSRRPLL